MIKKQKILLTALSIVGISAIFSYSLFSIQQLNNEVVNFESKNQVNPKNRYLINFKTATGIQYNETTSNIQYNIKKNILPVDGKYVEANGLDNRIALNIQELNKFNIANQEFIESLSFDLNGGFIKSSLEKNKTDYFSASGFKDKENNKKPFSFKFPDNYRPDPNKPIPILDFNDLELVIQNRKVGEASKDINLIIKGSFDAQKGILYITPQIRAVNNSVATNLLLSFDMPKNQDIFFSIESPFIWEDDGVLLDEYVSSEFRLSSGKDKITIGSRPDLQQNAIEEISFGSNNNENGGILINKLGDSKDILIDLRNLYYDDQLANGKEFDIILNNFKVDELQYVDIKAGVNEKFFPINFKMTVDNTIANDKDIILTHSFFNFISGTETENGSLKMNLVLKKQSNLVYKLESLNFKAEAGTEQINQFITIPLEQPDFISIVVKPNDFSAINGLQEIKKINKSPKMEIESTYSSDIFDDSKIDDGKTTSNFSKIKIDLYNRLTEQLFKTETFKKMGASPENFNPPIFSFEYLNENDYSNGYGRGFDIILL